MNDKELEAYSLILDGLLSRLDDEDKASLEQAMQDIHAVLSGHSVKIQVLAMAKVNTDLNIEHGFRFTEV